MGPLQLSFSLWLKPPVRSLGLTVWNLLKYTTIVNAYELRKKIFDFYYLAVICTTSLGTEQIRACVSCFDQSAWTANWWRSSKWCTYCKHRCAAVLAHHKMKRETSDASKRQLNQASWNRIVLKYGSGNQLSIHNYFSILLWFFPWYLWFSLDRTTWKKSRHYQFHWVCAAHLVYRSLVLKNVSITGIWIRKNLCWQKRQVSTNYLHAACVSSLTVQHEKSSSYSIFIFVISPFGCPPALDIRGRRSTSPLHATACIKVRKVYTSGSQPFYTFVPYELS